MTALSLTDRLLYHLALTPMGVGSNVESSSDVYKEYVKHGIGAIGLKFY